MGATQADLSLGVGPERARPALRPRFAGEARQLHKKQVPRARGPQAAWPIQTPTEHPFWSQFLQLQTFPVWLYAFDYCGFT
jgi:hypothetical protein